MILWFVGLAPAIVWNVFRDPAVDYRLVAVGAVAPDLVDLATSTGVSHTLLAPVALLVAVMVSTIGRRLLRRRLLALPIGWLLHLVLAGAWTDEGVFWWPFLGGGLGDASIPSAERWGPVGFVMELAGLAVIVWWWRRFRLVEPERRHLFVTQGRVGRDLVEGPPPWR